MGLSGFEVGLQRRSDSQPTDDEWEALWGNLSDEITSWLETRLTQDGESEVLEVVGEALEFVCTPPSDGELSIMFHDWEPVAEAAGYHWYRLAFLRHQDRLAEIAAEADFALSVATLKQEQDTTLFAVTDDYMVAILVDDHGDFDLEAGEDGPTLEELDEEERALYAKQVRKKQCQCSLCSPATSAS